MTKIKKLIPTERQCKICNQVKPIAEFRNGCAHMSYCHDCLRIKRREKYELKMTRYTTWQKEERKICEWCENLLYCKSQVRHGGPLHPDCEQSEPIEIIATTEMERIL